MATAIVGGQYGSEGKGLIAGHLAEEYSVHVRVGAANAGHTVYGIDDEKHVMQQLPCAAYANPHATLVLGPGAMITPEIFLDELVANAVWREQYKQPPMRLHIDPRAHVITKEHIEQEQATDLAERIGSTSTIAKEGIGAAQAARVLRTGYLMAGEWLEDKNLHDGIRDYCQLTVAETTAALHMASAFGGLLLEGTQGTGLSNITGQYPYVTSRNPTAAGLAADCGVGPRMLSEVILVCRTYPIRVAGNSGPFWEDSEEISWDEIGIDEENERTTVTKKVRRVATFSVAQIIEACWLNSATEIALTFCDYLDPEIAGMKGVIDNEVLAEYPNTAELVRLIEDKCRIPVRYLGTGPASVLRKVIDEPELQD
jgi:adenylosuccinate synthase